MQILILEDEEQALLRLKKLIAEVVPDAAVAGSAASVQEAVQWLLNNTVPDLIFMDIQLADGNSFQLFTKIKITCPVIFTTAYEDYALQAFKVNSVDYLLKPIDKMDVKRAIDKLKLLQSSRSFVADYSEILKTIQQPPKKYKDRFIVKLGDTIKSLNTPDIAYFYTENKTTFVCTNEGKRLPIDFNLDETEQMLNPKNFFRINRQFIIGHHAIEEMKAYTRSRVIVKLTPPSKLDTIVAIDRAQDFRTWLSE
jgi:two-component system, LytTR family, response regulator LytT